MRLPGLTDAGTTNWITADQFDVYGFRNGNGLFRDGTPIGFPQGLLWDYRKDGTRYVAIRAMGFDPEFKGNVRNNIRPDIVRMFRDERCIFTGTRTKVEIDHRAGDKRHPLHAEAINPATQRPEHFMPLSRPINQIKREQCKQCKLSGQRPELPPLFAHLEMKSGEGCFGCFWFEPELYV